MVMLAFFILFHLVVVDNIKVFLHQLFFMERLHTLLKIEKDEKAWNILKEIYFCSEISHRALSILYVIQKDFRKSHYEKFGVWSYGFRLSKFKFIDVRAIKKSLKEFYKEFKEGRGKIYTLPVTKTTKRLLSEILFGRLRGKFSQHLVGKGKISESSSVKRTAEHFKTLGWIKDEKYYSLNLPILFTDCIIFSLLKEWYSHEKQVFPYNSMEEWIKNVKEYETTFPFITQFLKRKYEIYEKEFETFLKLLNQIDCRNYRLAKEKEKFKEDRKLLLKCRIPQASLNRFKNVFLPGSEEILETMQYSTNFDDFRWKFIMVLKKFGPIVEKFMPKINEMISWMI